MCPCPQLGLCGVYICPLGFSTKCSVYHMDCLLAGTSSMILFLSTLLASSCWVSLDKCHLRWLASGFEFVYSSILERATSNCWHFHYWGLKGPFQNGRLCHVQLILTYSISCVSLSTVGLSDKEFFRIENISFWFLQIFV